MTKEEMIIKVIEVEKDLKECDEIIGNLGANCYRANVFVTKCINNIDYLEEIRKNKTKQKLNGPLSFSQLENKQKIIVLKCIRKSLYDYLKKLMLEIE